ncbi:MAG: MBL fold metallo-hydrolase [Candidatus Kapaibacteriales bacterium]
MNDKKLEITILGSGTSIGVPVVACKCPTCTSDDPRDNRLRCSIYVRYGETGIVIDTGPDFRQQMLRYGIDDIDGVVYTHLHYDHIAGFDDIRGFNFSIRKDVDAYAHDETIEALNRMFPYAFGKAIQQGGGLPTVRITEINNSPFTIGDITLEPLLLWHGKLKVLGFRIGDFAYCTDTNFIPEDTFEKLKGVKELIIDGLRPEKHPTHFNIEESLEAIARIAPQRAYITHIAHQIKHSDWEKKLPVGVELSYDGQKITLDYKS